MKGTLLIFLVVFILMQFIRLEKENNVSDRSLEIKTDENIEKMFRTSCYDCHSNEVKWPWYSEIAPFSWIISSHVNDARKALNFSKWDSYTEVEKQKKLKAIYRTVYELMPLKSYLFLHEEAELSKEQRKIIRQWTGVRK